MSTRFLPGEPERYLKVAKAEGAIFFYGSEDAKAWTIVRRFNLELLRKRLA